MYHSTTRCLIVALLCALTIYTSSCGPSGEKKQAQVTLQLNFKPGDRYLYTTEVKQNVNSFGMQMEQSMLMEMIYRVTATEGQHKKLEITYEHVAMKMGPNEYDSRRDSASNSDLAFVKNLIGKSFSLTLAPDGDITQVEGLENLVQSIAGTDKTTKAEIESQFSDTAIKLMMQNSFDLYPGKPVKAGEHWTKRSRMGFSGITVNVENTYTLVSVTDGKAQIKVSSIMQLPLTKMDVQGGQVAMEIEMTGNQDGSIQVDVESGQILLGNTSQHIKGNINVAGQSMPLTIDGDIKISSKKM